MDVVLAEELIEMAEANLASRLAMADPDLEKARRADAEVTELDAASREPLGPE